MEGIEPQYRRSRLAALQGGAGLARCQSRADGRTGATDTGSGGFRAVHGALRQGELGAGREGKALSAVLGVEQEIAVPGFSTFVDPPCPPRRTLEHGAVLPTI